MSHTVDITTLSAALKTLHGVPKEYRDKALADWSEKVLDGGKHNPLAIEAIESMRPHLRTDPDRRINVAKQRAGLTFGATIGSGIDTVVGHTKTGVHTAADATKKVFTRPAKTPESKPVAKPRAKKEQVRRHPSFYAWYYALWTLGLAAIGFIIWTFIGPAAGNLAADNFNSEAFGTFMSFVLLALLVSTGYLIGRKIVNRQRTEHDYKGALQSKEFDHWSHNVGRSWWIIVFIALTLVLFVGWWVSDTFGDALTVEFGAGNVAPRVMLLGTIVFGILLLIGWGIMALIRKSTNYVKNTEDKPRSEEEEKILPDSPTATANPAPAT